MKIYASIGSVVHGSPDPYFSTENLIPIFAAELKSLLSDCQSLNPIQKDYQKLVQEAEDFDYDNIDNENFLLGDLFCALDTFSPPGCYFGNHKDNKADYGFWPF